jgi:predicted permease
MNHLQDLRHAARALRRDPALVIGTVLTLGLGIGVVTGFFAIVDAVVFAPFAAHRDEVVRIWKHDAARNIAQFPLSYPELQMWRERARSVTALAAIGYANTSEAAVIVDEEAVPVRIAPVSADFFAVLHAGSPLFGRWLRAADEGNVNEVAAVVSEGFWRRIANGDSGFVGRRLMWPGNARALVVVGIAPVELSYPTGADLWVPIDGYFQSDSGVLRLDVRSRRLANFHFLARLAPGVSPDQARAELDVISAGITAQFPDDYRPMPVVAVPLLDATLGTLRPLTLVLFAAAALVFIAAGGNVAALLLMRASARARDMAVRVALGAGRLRIARQALFEAMLLGAGGTLAGLIVAQLSLLAGKSLAAAQFARLDQASLDARVFVFAIAATSVWVATFGTAPLWRRRFESGHLPQHLAIRSTRSAALLRVMIVAQVTAAVLVATAAGLLLRSLVHLNAVDRGFEMQNLAVSKVLLPESRYPTPADREVFFHRLLTKLRELPGVVNATTSHLGPGTGQTGLSAPMRFDGQELDEARQNQFATWEPIMPSYFETLGLGITEGRAFTDADDAGAPPVVIVSESVVGRYWPGQDPIGKRVQFTPQFPWATVVGVVADTRYREVTKAWMTAYFPAKQFFFFSPNLLIVRTATDPIAMLPAIRQAVLAQEPAAAVYSSETMESAAASELSRPRTAVAIAALFALAAIFVAAIGVYGVVSYEVSYRARELALHAAIGASPRQIRNQTLRRSLAVGAVGAVFGLGAASLLTRYLATLLFEIQPLDAVTFAAAGVSLLAIVLAASLVPARRAAAIDPAVLLKTE